MSTSISAAPRTAVCFNIGGVRKFFVEARKSSVDIAADSGPTFQLSRRSRMRV
jgi:hypothetical protein